MSNALDPEHAAPARAEPARADSGDPDRGALERAAAGDRESFGVLVERHQKRLHRLCYRMLGDAEEAREATQEVFFKAYRSAGSYKPGGRVYTWLYRIATNHCLNRLRRRKIVSFFGFGDLTPEDEEASWDPADSGPDAEQRLAARRAWPPTRRHTQRLPPSPRPVPVPAKFAGLPYRDIAAPPHTPVGAVESRLFRAMQRLVAEAAAADA